MTERANAAKLSVAAPTAVISGDAAKATLSIDLGPEKGPLYVVIEGGGLLSSNGQSLAPSAQPSGRVQWKVPATASETVSLSWERRLPVASSSSVVWSASLVDAAGTLLAEDTVSSEIDSAPEFEVVRCEALQTGVDVVEYRLRIANVGDAIARGVRAIVATPVGAVARQTQAVSVQGESVVLDFGDIAASESAEASVEFDVPALGSIETLLFAAPRIRCADVAAARFGAHAIAVDTFSLPSVTASLVCDEGGDEVGVAKPASAGGMLSAHLRVSNDGPGSARDLHVRLRADSALRLIPSSLRVSGRRYVINEKALDGESLDISLADLKPNNEAVVDILAAVASSNESGKDQRICAAIEWRNGTAFAEASVPIVAAPAFASPLSAIYANAPRLVGHDEWVEFLVDIENEGTAALVDGKIICVPAGHVDARWIPSGLPLPDRSQATPHAPPDTVSAPLGRIEPGARRRIRFALRTMPHALNGSECSADAYVVGHGSDEIFVLADGARVSMDTGPWFARRQDWLWIDAASVSSSQGSSRALLVIKNTGSDAARDAVLTVGGQVRIEGTAGDRVELPEIAAGASISVPIQITPTVAAGAVAVATAIVECAGETFRLQPVSVSAARTNVVPAVDESSGQRVDQAPIGIEAVPSHARVSTPTPIAPPPEEWAAFGDWMPAPRHDDDLADVDVAPRPALSTDGETAPEAVEATAHDEQPSIAVAASREEDEEIPAFREEIAQPIDDVQAGTSDLAFPAAEFDSEIAAPEESFASPAFVDESVESVESSEVVSSQQHEHSALSETEEPAIVQPEPESVTDDDIYRPVSIASRETDVAAVVGESKDDDLVAVHGFVKIDGLASIIKFYMTVISPKVGSHPRLLNHVAAIRPFIPPQLVASFNTVNGPLTTEDGGSMSEAKRAYRNLTNQMLAVTMDEDAESIHSPIITPREIASSGVDASLAKAIDGLMVTKHIYDSFEPGKGDGIFAAMEMPGPEWSEVLRVVAQSPRHGGTYFYVMSALMAHQVAIETELEQALAGYRAAVLAEVSPLADMDAAQTMNALMALRAPNETDAAFTALFSSLQSVSRRLARQSQPVRV